MKARQYNFSEDIINHLRYLVEPYCSIILRTIQSENEGVTVVKCHTEARIGKIRDLVFLVSVTGKPIYVVTAFMDMTILMFLFCYSSLGL